MQALINHVRHVAGLALGLGLMGCMATQDPAKLQVQVDNGKFSQPAAKTRPWVNETYSKLPMHFEANQGQADAQVKFLSRGRGYTLFLTSTEAVMVLATTQTDSDMVTGQRPLTNPKSKIENPKSTVLRMKLIGANPQPQVIGLEELPGKVNYFIGNDLKKWRKKVPTYAKVKYQGVYPGVDLVFYGNQQQLEYDFVLAPGADPKAIRLSFEGADKVEIDTQGDLLLYSTGSEIRLRKPHIYQEVAGVRKEISGGYVLNPKPKIASDLTIQNPKSEIENGTIGFQVASYDTSKPLVIDPVLVYSTYLGGNHNDRGFGIAVDAAGNAYIMGLTRSTDFPTVNPFQPGLAGSGHADLFVAKLDTQGSMLLYSTYLGGSNEEGFAFISGYEFAGGIAVDSSGQAHVTGFTLSADFPTANALQPAFGGGFSDAFVTKLNPDGTELVYSTYLGGGDRDLGSSVAVDPIGNAYVTGSTKSTNFPTASPLQPGLRGIQDAFVTKLNADGSAMVYSTYLGGSVGGGGLDEGFGIAVDSSGNAYVMGATFSLDFPTTAEAFQPDFAGIEDAFVTKLNPDGSALVYSSYLGGNHFDRGVAIAVDAADNAYLLGMTQSRDFPTVNPFQPAHGGGFEDVFVAKLNATGSALVYSTYLGGSENEYGGGIAVDTAGNAYVTGVTFSTNFPTANPLQPGHGGARDAFVAKLNTQGSALVYSTYLGGSGIDMGGGIGVDAAGNAYVTGMTVSSDFPIVNPLQPILGLFGDAFIAKIADGAGPAADLSIFKTDSPDPVTVGQDLTYTVVATNNGPNPATGVTLTDTLPGTVTFVSATPSETCTETGGVVTCAIGNLASGANATVTIVVAPTMAGVITNTASVTGIETDPDPTNNTATETTTVTLNNQGTYMRPLLR